MGFILGDADGSLDATSRDSGWYNGNFAVGGGAGFTMFGAHFLTANQHQQETDHCCSKKDSHHQQKHPLGPGFVDVDTDEHDNIQMGVCALRKGVQIRAWPESAHTAGQEVQGSRESITVSP